MKLTQTLLTEAPSFISPTESRTLSLRNQNLSSLDSIHVLESSDIHSTLDISKNSISYLPKFPQLLNLSTLLLANNHIRTIQGLEKLINLEVISLAYNEILHLSDLEGLKQLTSLRALYLTGNPVLKNKDYRLWCIWRFPSLQVLDFQRIKDSERKQAALTFENDTEKVAAILSIEPYKPAPESGESQPERSVLSNEERIRFEKELEQAESLEEIQRLEEILTRGYFKP